MAAPPGVALDEPPEQAGKLTDFLSAEPAGDGVAHVGGAR